MASTNHLSNWGRWGAEDERGSLNLITPELIKQAAGLVKTGQVYSLAMPLEADGPQWPARHKTWTVTTFRNDPADSGSADDVVTMHSHSGTHMDALCHVWYHNQLYNGFNAAENISTKGAVRNSIDKVPFIIGRGVLLDIARWKGVDHLGLGEPVTASDLDQCAESQSIKPQTGDILLVRTGWLRVFEKDRALFDRGEPGLDLSTLPWLKRHDIVAVGVDNHAVEVLAAIPPDGVPFHRIAIRDLGIYLLEYLNLEALAASRVYEFLFIVAPLKLTAGVGSPINPIAIT
jgi:kynurenine formamidase